MQRKKTENILPTTARLNHCNNSLYHVLSRKFFDPKTYNIIKKTTNDFSQTLIETFRSVFTYLICQQIDDVNRHYQKGQM